LNKRIRHLPAASRAIDEPAAAGQFHEARTPRLILRAALGVLVVLLLAAPIGVAQARPNDTFSPKRVVALTPFSANAMAMMGAFPAAVGETLGDARPLAPALNSTPVLTLNHTTGGPTKEELSLYSPRLIFTSPVWRDGRQIMEDIVEESGGGRVIDADPKSVQASYATARRIARLVNRKSRGKRLIRQMKRQVAGARKGIKVKPRVMLILGVGGSTRVFLENSWGGQLVKLAGGRLLTGGASSSSGFANIGDDVVVPARPDVIIAVPHSRLDNRENTIKNLAKKNEAWQSTPAVRNDRFYISDDNRLLQAGVDIGATIRIIRKKFLKNG